MQKIIDANHWDGRTGAIHIKDDGMWYFDCGTLSIEESNEIFGAAGRLLFKHEDSDFIVTDSGWSVRPVRPNGKETDMALGFAGHHDNDEERVAPCDKPIDWKAKFEELLTSTETLATDNNSLKARHEEISTAYASLQERHTKLSESSAQILDGFPRLRELAREARAKTLRLQQNVRQMQKAAVKRKQAVRSMRERLVLAEGQPDLARPPTFPAAKRIFERQYCVAVLRLTKGNVTAAAHVAGKERKDFYDLLARTGIDPDGFRP